MTDKLDTLNQIWPKQIDHELIIEAYSYRELLDRPYLRINMVSSLDGSISIEGRTRELSSVVDRCVFHALRSYADVIFVGAGTMRVEEYKSVSLSEEEQDIRIKNNQIPIPPIAVVSRSGEFNFESDFFTKAIVKPIILTSEIGARVAENDGLADIVICGKTQVDINVAVKELILLGYKNILCEGGPSLNAELLKKGLVDELCLTINPIITQGNDKGIFDGHALDKPIGFDISHMFFNEGQLFLRLKNISESK